MGVVSESSSRRLTLGYLAGHYGFDMYPEFASAVTVTSLADTLDSVKPGSLYMPGESLDARTVDTALSLGAYAAVLPRFMKGKFTDPQYPILFADPSAQELGALAADMAGAPADSLAVFAICGENEGEIDASALQLTDFLHMLGNPVGLISASGSTSLERQLDLEYPLSIFNIQYALSICVEDGASAVIIAVDRDTLRNNALQSVDIDVLGGVGRAPAHQRHDMVRQADSFYGFTMNKDRGLIMATEESDTLANQTSSTYDDESKQHLSLSIAMVLAAGVRKSSIRSALRVSRDLG